MTWQGLVRDKQIVVSNFLETCTRLVKYVIQTLRDVIDTFEILVRNKLKVRLCYVKLG
jgi:hypothetical protein